MQCIAQAITAHPRGLGSGWRSVLQALEVERPSYPLPVALSPPPPRRAVSPQLDRPPPALPCPRAMGAAEGGLNSPSPPSHRLSLILPRSLFNTSSLQNLETLTQFCFRWQIAANDCTPPVVEQALEALQPVTEALYRGLGLRKEFFTDCIHAAMAVALNKFHPDLSLGGLQVLCVCVHA